MPQTGTEGLMLSRRRFVQGLGAAGAGLVIGFHWSAGSRRASAAETDLAPNAFLRIAPDGTVTVISKHIEFGQGTYTGLATLVAEELDADWSTVRVESAPADAERYANLFFGGVQGTGGSTAMANSWEQFRRAGAVGRAMLMQAAAARWGVPAAELSTDRGQVRHEASGRSAGYGDLAAAAAGLEVPESVALKEPERFRLIGTRLGRVDSAAKSDGSALFTADVALPDTLTALLLRPPRFGATVRSVDDSAARAVPGVVEVVQVPRGVAVLARGFWAAQRGRQALEVEWDDSGAETRGSDDLFREYQALAREPGVDAARRGDLDAAFDGAGRVLTAEYRFPYLAHAPMEPLDAVIRRTDDGGAEIWAGSQLQTVDQQVAAGILGVPPEKVRIHTLFGGGSFGRRATPNADVAAEAASLLKAVGGRRPIKLLWTREDDIRGGRYRPLYLHRLRAALDDAGRPVAWEQRIVGQSIARGTPFEAALVADGVDATSVEGARDLPYAIPNFAVELHTTDVGVPVLWWRSVGHTHTGYSTETFMDELAEAAGADPVEFRLGLLAEHPRHRGVLQRVAEASGWGDAAPEGRARGVAVHKSFSSYVAQVAEVSRGPGGLPRVHRVVCAVDCGIAINPHNIEAQMQSGIGYGLGAALYNEIVLEEGRVRQSNFDGYRPLRINDMPEVEVHVVASGEAPTGVGEPGVPPVAAAVANAWYRLTGERVRRLPFSRSRG